ncbi:hypothetical protein JR316_0006539 [Psilocybe cubensis]|uniref:Uncharacterized protein n=1 Tax=Psilocybe cubensis TaxID=181762 RepID=A0ACB8H2S6_PSICU|nr:hypothetical protein JR316_0006539 [Psilocybe cubensis]KAH9482009.1 hypothetical protein JR316_0006539 [Psilocybe cubensis]
MGLYTSDPSCFAQVDFNGLISENYRCGTDQPLRLSSGDRDARKVAVLRPSTPATDFSVAEGARSNYSALPEQNYHSASSMETTWPPVLRFQPAIPIPESIPKSSRLMGIKPSPSHHKGPAFSRVIARPTVGSLQLPTRPVEIISPKPYKCYQTATFLREESYGNTPYQSSRSDNDDVFDYSEERERELLSTSLLLSMNEACTEDPLRPALGKPLPLRPLWPSVTPSFLETAVEDYSSCTSAYHTFLSPLEPKPKTPEVDSITARLELLNSLVNDCDTPSTPMSMPALASPAGSDSDLSNSGTGSASIDSSPSSISSFNTSLASLDDATSVKEDLQGYTERMVAQIFDVCKLEEIVASTWFLAMQAKFLACQDHAASQDRATEREFDMRAFDCFELPIPAPVVLRDPRVFRMPSAWGTRVADVCTICAILFSVSIIKGSPFARKNLEFLLWIRDDLEEEVEDYFAPFFDYDVYMDSLSESQYMLVEREGEKGDGYTHNILAEKKQHFTEDAEDFDVVDVADSSRVAQADSDDAELLEWARRLKALLDCRRQARMGATSFLGENVTRTHEDEEVISKQGY